MAEIDDFDFEGLGSKLTNTILDSFDDALGMIKFSSVGKSLTTALGGVDMAKALSKPLGDGITKLTKNDPNISKAMKDVQKMLEDGFTKVKFKTGPVEVAKISPQVVKLLADTSGLKLPKIKAVDVPVKYKPSELKQLEAVEVPVKYKQSELQQPKAVEVPVIYKPGKLQQLKAVNVDVNYKLTNIPTPKVKAVEVPVKYKLSELPSPKVKSIEIPVKYKADKLEVLKSEPVTVPVEYDYGKFQLPKNQKLEVPVIYKPGKLQQLKAVEVPVLYRPSKLQQLKPVDVLVNYKQGKLPQPKAINIDVNYKPSKLPQPKAINVDVNYKPGKLQQPKSIEVPVVYKQSKLEQLKVKAIDIPVKYKPNELKLPKAPNIVVAVKYLYDKFKLPKTQEVSVKLAPDTTKLMSGLTDVVNKTKSAVNTVFASRSISVNADTTNAEQQIAAAFKETTIPVTAVSQAAQAAQPTSTMDTGSFEKAGNLVREFVILTDEANKKTTITTELYNKIVGIAQKIVSSKRMEAGAVNDIIETLSKKIDVPPVEVGAKVTSVDTSSISDAASKIAPIEISATVSKTKTPTTAATKAPKADYDLTGLASQKKMTTEVTKLLLEQPEKFGMSRKQAAFLGAALKNNLKYQEDINSESDSFVEKLKMMAVKGRETSEEGYKYSAINTEINRLLGNTHKLQLGLNEQRREGIKLALRGKEGSQEALYILENQLEVFEDQARALGHEGKLAEYVSKQLANGVQYTKITQSQTYKTLANLQAQQKITSNLSAAQGDYNNALKQAKADIRIKNQTIQLRLTEQETSELAYQAYQQNLSLRTMGLLTNEQKKQIAINGGLTDEQVKQIKLENHKLRHLREEREIVEHVANYQKEVNEELEKYSMGWKKTKATISAILKDPAFAKSVLFASAVEGARELTHKMHEFKEVGMDAGTAVQAQLHSLSIASIMGLSKSEDVTKSLVTQYGNMNALTSEQVNNVGKLAANNGLAGDEATNMVMAMGRMPGMTRETASHSEEMFKSIGKTKGVIPSQIMKEMAKNTANMAIYSKGGAQGFAMAAASAKRMGVELNTVLSAARKSLDFESSLNAQMEASVMLGKELNMDKLRQATLSGDANAIMREQQNLIKQAGGLENMNVLQKEKLAEMMGMSVEDMQKMNDEAVTQNKYFGEQAGIFSNLLGYSMKYGEGLVTGFTKLAPLVTGVSSLMSIMSTTSMKGIASSVWSTVRGLAAGAVQLTIWLAKMIALGAVKLFGGGKEGVDKVNKFFGKGTSVVEKIKGKKPELPGGSDKVSEVGDKASKASDKTKTVQSGKGVKDFLTNLAAGLKAMGDGKVLFGAVNLIPASIGLVAMIPGVLGAKIMEKIDGKKVKESLLGLAKGIEAFGSGKVTGGALNLIVASIGLVGMIPGALGAFAIQNLVDGKKISKSLSGLSEGIQSFANSKVLLGSLAMILAAPGLLVISIAALPLSIVGALGTVIEKGLKALAKGIGYMGDSSVFKGALGLALVGLSLIPAAIAFKMIQGIDPGAIAVFSVAIIGLSIAAALLGNVAAQMIMGAVAIGILGLALIPMAAAFQMVAGLDPNALLTFGLALVGFSLAAAGLGMIAPLIYVGAGAIAVLGLSLIPFAMAMAIAAPATEKMGAVLKSLSGANSSKNIDLLSKSLFGLAKGLFAVGAAGMLALPTLIALNGITSKPAAPTTPSATPAAATTTAVAPAPKAMPTATAAATTTTVPTTQQAAPAPAPAAGGDMKELMAKFDQLISIMQSGATITMDGQKVASIVQKNIRSIKFNS